MTIILALAIAYLLGSIPTAYWAGRLSKGIDLRQHGSGNLGFTNAWRLLGPAWSIPVLIIDIGKGALVVLIAWQFAPENEWLAAGAGLCAILGHTCTVFLGFRGGGKGVATSAGVFLILTPLALLAALVMLLALLYSVRIMSVASIGASLTLVISVLALRMLGSPMFSPSDASIGLSCAAAAFVIIKHHANIKRLLKGTEPKL